MSEIPLVEISRIVVLSQALFIGLYGLLFTLKAPLGRAITAFGFCSVGGVILRFTWDGWQFGFAYYFMVLGVSATPVVVWLITQYVFDDEFKTRPAFWLLVLSYLTLNLVGRLAYANDQVLSVFEKILFYYVPQLTKLGFALHIMLIAALGMKTDLIEQRRRLRAPFALLAGLLICISLGSQMVNRGFQFAIPDGIEVIYNLVLAYGITLSAFRLRFSISPDKRSQKEPAKAEVLVEGAELIEEKLKELMQGKKYYLTSGITIGALAEELGEPEYKLRRIINGHLGFRNFNQYINSMRVRDAEVKLLASDLPVVSIAKELGYVSLSSFNKAFRDIHQWTPSEFRVKKREEA